MGDSTTRFSDRVENYGKYRPSYPAQALEWLCQQFSLNAESTIADIGSGTGIFTGLLLDRGFSVIAVEPNKKMLAESDRLLSSNKSYKSVSGKAEKTTLNSSSIDLVVSAQAFHWFDSEKFGVELKRILKPEGAVMLIWNRRESSSGFQSEYEQLLQALPEYNKVKHTRIDDADITRFFGGTMQAASFKYEQKFNLESFKGRVFSSSYTPSPKEESYSRLERRLDDLFDRHSVFDEVIFEYRTMVYAGRPI